MTLAKVTSVDQVEAMVFACACLEAEYGIAPLRFEIQVETPQAVVGPDGSAQVARMLHASEGRCTGLHYGTYDYSAACGIAAAYQSMEHPVADHAKAVMQAAAAGRASSSPTAPPMCCRSATTPCPRGGCTPASYGGRSNAASTRGGICTPPSCRAATSPRTPSSAGTRPRPWSGSGRTRTAGVRPTSTKPATAAALVGFLLRGVECGALDERELGIDGGLLHRLARREGGQP